MPQYLVLLLPLIVSALNGLFTDFKFPQWVNTLICMVVVLGSALAWALLAQRLVSDPIADFVVIAGFSAALVAGPLQPLEKYLKITLPSPLKLIVPTAKPAPASTTPMVQRASLLPSDQFKATQAQTPVQSTPAPAQPVQQTTQDASITSDSSNLPK